MPFKPTVYIIDDDKAIGEAISWLLATVNLPVQVYLSAEAFLQAYNPQWRGCLLIDVRMPGMSGLELQQQLVARNNSIPIMMISGHGDVPMAVRAMQAGARDFIVKPFNDQELLDKINAAIKADQQKANNQSQRLKEAYTSLTLRELDVLKLIVAGKLNKQIATELDIAMSTVEFHRARIMRKMQVNTLADLIKASLLLEK